jgi:hypothetical protein
MANRRLTRDPHTWDVVLMWQHGGIGVTQMCALLVRCHTVQRARKLHSAVNGTFVVLLPCAAPGLGPMRVCIRDIAAIRSVTAASGFRRHVNAAYRLTVNANEQRSLNSVRRQTQSSYSVCNSSPDSTGSLRFR